MKYKIIFFVLLAFSLLDCSHSKQKIKNATYYSDENFGSSIFLRGETLSMDTLWEPTRIWCEDSLLIFSEPKNGFLVSVFHKKKGNKVAENIPFGNGPEERLSCWTLQFDSQSVWAFDLLKSTLTLYKKSDFLTQSYTIPEKSVAFLNREGITGIVCLQNGLFVASSLSDHDNLLTIYDPEGNRMVSKVIPFPEPNAYIPSNLVKRFYENRIFYNKENDRIVLFYRYTDLIDIYDSDLNLLARIHGPDQFIPELGIRHIGERPQIYVENGKTKIAFQTAQLTSKEIWVSYEGVSPEKDKELDYPNRIFVFDYNGTPLRRYELEHRVSSFCIDEEENVLYGLSEVQFETCVIKFNL